jgi:iron complex transport system substrate-binding protein
VPRSEKPLVLIEWYRPYQSFQTSNVYQAGGVNIAENISLYAPQLSSEFVVQQNPDIIIRLISSLPHDKQDFIDQRIEIMNRPALANVTAVQKGQVYICDYAIRGGVACVTGYLYWAKWCQPSLFTDMDPEAIGQQMYQEFYGVTIEGTFAYP